MAVARSNEVFKIQIEDGGRSWKLASPIWPTLQLDALTCEMQIDGNTHCPSEVRAETTHNKDTLRLTWTFRGLRIRLIQTLSLCPGGSLNLHSELENLSEVGVILNRVTLVKLEKPKHPVFGREQEEARVYEQGGYWGHVRPLSRPINQISDRAEQTPSTGISGTSQTCWVIHNQTDHMALLVGFTTFDRWLGTISIRYDPTSGVKDWAVGFDGGDLLIDPGQTVQLEDVVFLVAQDPWNLLEEFGDFIGEKYGIRPLENPPVSWCSWYPYRLGVTEEHVLANAKTAARRLEPLGLETFQVDYGWEKGHLPSFYEESEQFPHGLKWLSEELGKMGFNLGAWKAPFTISEFDPLFQEHPEWLLGDEKEKPKPYWTWFWEPHGKVYALDLTHPGAQEYVREKMTGLAAKGVRYLKLDFIGGPCDPLLRKRHNPRMVTGGGTEAVRLGSKIIAEAIETVDPRCVVLNCNPYEACGLGYFDLLYACNDTGNTGYITWSTMRDNYTSVACHLWKNHRLGIIEPSCLCVGLPGIIEEARMRATATFLSGGEVDIGDDLTTLPEDRWQVLLSILPPSSKSAKPIDLFEPVVVEQLPYSEMSAGLQKEPTGHLEQEGSSVWHMHMETDWDAWALLGLFAWEPPRPHLGKQENPITRYRIGWERLNLDLDKRYWIYEFWSGQFLGEIPGSHEAPKGYIHPGDAKTLLWGTQRGVLQVAFFGPSVKLLVIREAHTHPWVVGTSFHISGGSELHNVEWDEKERKLSGELHRPSGQEGFIMIAGVNGCSAVATVGGRSVPVLPSANYSMKIPVLTEGEVTTWSVEIT